MFCGLGEEEGTIKIKEEKEKGKKYKKTHHGIKWVGRDKRVSRVISKNLKLHTR